jgi:hypothetical protein
VQKVIQKRLNLARTMGSVLSEGRELQLPPDKLQELTRRTALSITRSTDPVSTYDHSTVLARALTDCVRSWFRVLYAPRIEHPQRPSFEKTFLNGSCIFDFRVRARSAPISGVLAGLYL